MNRLKKLFRWLFSLHNIMGFAMLALALVIFFQSPTPLFLQAIRNQTFDLYQRLEPRQPDPAAMEAQVIIVDIDDAALESVGQWPWPRATLAQLVDKLTASGAGVIGFDVVFAEEDRLSPPKLAHTVPGLSPTMVTELERMPSSESLFADSLKASRVVLGHAGHHMPTDAATLPHKVGFFRLQRRPSPIPPEQYLDKYPGLLRNITELESAAKGIGLISFEPDPLDNIARKVPLLARVQDKIYPSLSLEMIRLAMGTQDDYVYKTSEMGIDGVIVKGGGGFEIPTTPEGSVWVHYARYTTNDPIYISAKDVFELAPKPLFDRIGGKFVLIGTSAIGLKDIRATPLSSNTPGVEVHAQVLENMLLRTHLKRTDTVTTIEGLVILIGGLLLIFFVRHMSAVWNFLFSTTIVLGLTATAWYFYTDKQELLDVAYPSIVITLMFVVLTYLNYMNEEKERRQVRTAFSHYVSPALLEELAADPSKLKLGGETRNITLMFSDIRGFTTISEQFDAEGLTRFINKFLTPMTNIILEHKGTIDKYMGDAIMAFWNAPLSVPDHPRHACSAALEMFDGVVSLNNFLEEEAEREGRLHTPVAIGVGLNSGDCCVGNMGSDQRFDYSALGDHVNLAARLEGQSKTYGVGIVISENTVNELEEGEFALFELDLIQVKGKTEPVRIFALAGNKDMAKDADFISYKTNNQAMLDAYRAQQFDRAGELLRKARSMRPDLDVFHALYEDRIAAFRITPPPAEWDGVFIATSK